MSERFQIVWAPVAVGDVGHILEYIAVRDGLTAATRIHTKLIERINALVTTPSMCRVVPELRSLGVTAYRELFVAPYRIFFRLGQKTVSIVGVLDGRRDLEELLLERVLET